MNVAKRWTFRILAAAGAFAVALAAAEWAARRYELTVRTSDRMDPGLTQYDPRLGWVLQPGWQGRHVHHDFDVRYSVNADGFRRPGRERTDRSPSDRRVAVLGDSFTFGLGAEDDETFLERANAAAAPGWEFVNHGVPGYSTDQEYLLLQREILATRPAAVLLVVYVANDLLDNQYPFPLQAGGAKPFFELGADGLALRNDPVPQARKSGADAARTLAAAVFGETGPPRTAPAWLDRWALAARIPGLRPDRPVATLDFAPRLGGSVRLFEAILARMADACRERATPFVCAVLSGRSHIEQPGSASAQYQEYYRAAVRRAAGRLELPVIDLAAGLETARSGGSRGLFHPNDGHLTASGHRVVAETLSSEWAALATLQADAPVRGRTEVRP